MFSSSIYLYINLYCSNRLSSASVHLFTHIYTVAFFVRCFFREMGKVPTKVPKFIKVSFGFLSCTATLPFLGILNHMRSTKLDPTLPKQAVSHIFQEKSHCTELKSFRTIWVQRKSYLFKKPKMFCTFENLKVKRWKNPQCWILKIQNVLNLWISNELLFFAACFS